MLFDTGEDQMKGGRVVRFFCRVLLAFSMLTDPLRKRQAAYGTAVSPLFLSPAAAAWAPLRRSPCAVLVCGAHPARLCRSVLVRCS